ncbi:MAG TPA: DNA primase, partial [Pyrinomonadaceae bacterium]|nr:DNA primase [Pyrinomonadaceae bacterium]
MRYPQTFIDDLKRQADIVRVIQDYVQLKKKGANWMACCPFHKEKTPSFSVSPAKEIFYCFGCHKGGSVFNFVMEIERVAFPEAIKIVADKIGMPLPKLIDDSRFEARRQESDEVVELNSWALDWWEKQLESSAEGRIARDYLNQRELTDETQKTFRLGYAIDSWDALSTYLRQKGATQQQIERSGLVVKKDEGGSYDRFRGRLMFPVFDHQGRPIAFGGRTLKNEDAKYINSPETAAYVKGRNLFGLNLTRDEIRRSGFAILVEGFLDLIVPYQSGVKNIVASLGTALTSDQVKLISRFARKVVVNYDGDRAGVQAAKKSIEILLAEDLEVKVLVLPDGADPDEYIRKFGVTEYQRRRAQAQPHIQFVIENALRGRNLHRPAEKGEA